MTEKTHEQILNDDLTNIILHSNNPVVKEIGAKMIDNPEFTVGILTLMSNICCHNPFVFQKLQLIVLKSMLLNIVETTEMPNVES